LKTNALLDTNKLGQYIVLNLTERLLIKIKLQNITFSRCKDPKTPLIYTNETVNISQTFPNYINQTILEAIYKDMELTTLKLVTPVTNSGSSRPTLGRPVSTPTIVGFCFTFGFMLIAQAIMEKGKHKKGESKSWISFNPELESITMRQRERELDEEVNNV
jgi:hypothetical protein